jgi:hypothetical protein
VVWRCDECEATRHEIVCAVCFRMQSTSTIEMTLDGVRGWTARRHLEADGSLRLVWTCEGCEATWRARPRVVAAS